MMQFPSRASLFAAVMLVPIGAQASSSQTEMTVGGSLRIEMRSDFDSLNVAAASAVALHHFAR